jgi:Flp pilus assembly protein TadG
MQSHRLARLRHFGRKLSGLWSCDRGSVAPLVGVAMITLVGAVGVAVDVGRGQVAQSKLQASLDSAGLAAGAMVGQTLDSDDLKPEAEKYLEANFNGDTIEATIIDFDLELSEDNSLVTLEATATLPTTFMRIFGEEIMQVSARSEITRETKGLEVALVLDVTGSMDDPVGGSPYDSTKKIAALRVAAKDLVSILFGSNDTVDDLWVGVVPFSQSVNIGTSRTDWLEDYATRAAEDNCIGTTNPSSTPNCSGMSPMYSGNVSTRTNPVTLVDDWMHSSDGGWYFEHGWGGCVLERWDNDRDVTDDPPATQKWETYYVPDTNGSTPSPPGNNNNWLGNSSGNSFVNNSSDVSANKGCPQQPITTLTNVKADLISAVDDLVNPRGNTHINVGAVWGWRLLSPEWRGLWGGAMDSNSLPLDYDEPLSQKAMILMTDGTNTMSSSIYTAYGWLSESNLGTTSSSTAVTKLNNKTTTVCNAMKAEGILIYTIVFGNDSSTTSKNLMKACASEEDFYFFSPSQGALSSAFKAIGDSLSKLRVSK